MDTVIRVSADLKRLLDDPFSMPKTQPHCIWCGNPKTEARKKRKCEICGNYGYQSGIVQRGTPRNVFIEYVKNSYVTRTTLSGRTVRIARRVRDSGDS